MRHYTDNGKKYYGFVNRTNGKVLDFSGFSMGDGEELIQCEYNGGKDHDFRLLKTKGKYYCIE